MREKPALNHPLNVRPAAVRWACFAAPLVVALGLAACGGGDDDQNELDFTRPSEGWQAGFADYRPGDADFDLVSGVRSVPGIGDAGYLLGGTNRSDDLFMFVHRAIDGLKPNHPYRVSFEVTLASNASNGCTGVGGQPGESVTVKAGATGKALSIVPDKGGILLLNPVDKGDQTVGGADALVLGDLSNGSTDCLNPSYRRKTLSGGPLLTRTDAQGRLRVFFGTDSGYESRTEVYWLKARLTLSPQ